MMLKTITDKLVKYWRNILICVLFLILMLCINECTKNMKIYQQDQKNQKAMNDSLETVIDKQGNKIYFQSQIITNKDSEIAKRIEEIEGLRKIKQQVKWKTKIVYDTVEVPIPSPDITRTDSGNFLKIPAKFVDTTTSKWYGMLGEITEEAKLKFDKLYFCDEPSITFGYKKRSFKETILLKEPEPTVAYKNNNPNSKLMSMENITIDDKKYKLGLSVGPIIGYGFTPTGTGFFIGIGVQPQKVSIKF